MKAIQSQFMYGVFIIIAGAIIGFLSYVPSPAIQYGGATGIFISAVFAFITAAKNKNTLIQFKYHGLQGAGMVAYATGILVYGSSIESFITITMAFLVYFGFTEIIFGFQLLKTRAKIRMSVIVLRMVTGILMAVGAVIIFAIAALDKNMSLLMAGILIALCGINFILFANAIRRLPISA